MHDVGQFVFLRIKHGSNRAVLLYTAIDQNEPILNIFCLPWTVLSFRPQPQLLLKLSASNPSGSLPRSAAEKQISPSCGNAYFSTISKQHGKVFLCPHGLYLFVCLIQHFGDHFLLCSKDLCPFLKVCR